MVFGMSLAAYTFMHVVISLVGIGTGLFVLFGMIDNKRLEGWTGLFLAFTFATSLTGFGFPFVKLLPSHIVGLISLVAPALAVLARYQFHLAGGWRKTYVITAVLALYLNVFVLVVQSFLKVPFLHALAPAQTETPFKAAQLAVLVIFAGLTFFAVKKFRK